jgi:hypothetical protein
VIAITETGIRIVIGIELDGNLFGHIEAEARTQVKEAAAPERLVFRGRVEILGGCYGTTEAGG